MMRLRNTRKMIIITLKSLNHKINLRWAYVNKNMFEIQLVTAYVQGSRIFYLSFISLSYLVI